MTGRPGLRGSETAPLAHANGDCRRDGYGNGVGNGVGKEPQWLRSFITAARLDRKTRQDRFTTPTIANDKVYIGTSNPLDVYGVL